MESPRESKTRQPDLTESGPASPGTTERDRPAPPPPGTRFRTLERLPVKLTGSDRRVIGLPFVPGSLGDVAGMFDLVLAMEEREAREQLEALRASFAGRHLNLDAQFEDHFHATRSAAGETRNATGAHRLLLGAYFTMEYSLQAAALFNPSIVPHPDQRGAQKDAVRFIMSLRATGEGHVSSVVFEEGLINKDGRVMFERSQKPYRRPELSPDPHYLKALFLRKLKEMGAHSPSGELILAQVPDRFTLWQLEQAVVKLTRTGRVSYRTGIAEDVLWLARSNYELHLVADTAVSDVVIFPHSDSESRGIEDLRLVRFTEDDGSIRYYGTYTAFNGERTLPMLMETARFRRMKFHTLNGAAVQNKGLALFPRRINGHFAMCSRNDGRNLFLMYSDLEYFWETATPLASPKFPWEYRLIGNCGSPLETREGWLLITHGVGPMRQYAIGAMLLDFKDPAKIRGRLKTPLLSPSAEDRDGYVPNVVYSCGSLIHRGRLYLPYAAADKVTAMASVEVEEVLAALIEDGP